MTVMMTTVVSVFSILFVMGAVIIYLWQKVADLTDLVYDLEQDIKDLNRYVNRIDMATIVYNEKNKIFGSFYNKKAV
ncbi:MAG: hypothetical protein LBS29_04355 [Endomicrobium sp.]|jgi:predicted PurR-regulated permease PerM|nr:hypothetical protein [Endomicrobium sp.]